MLVRLRLCFLLARRWTTWTASGACQRAEPDPLWRVWARFQTCQLRADYFPVGHHPALLQDIQGQWRDIPYERQFFCLIVFQCALSVCRWLVWSGLGLFRCMLLSLLRIKNVFLTSLSHKLSTIPGLSVFGTCRVTEGWWLLFIFVFLPRWLTSFFSDFIVSIVHYEQQ